MESFEEIELIPALQRALAAANYERPTEIQAKSIPHALAGRDVLGCAQTGTGKTAAFVLPILNQLGQSKRRAAPGRPLALILSPTRELAVQIGENISTYGRYLKIRATLVYGGVSQVQQVRNLRRGTRVLVATPGRLLDLMEQGHIKLDQLEHFVLDEADRMLDMGFLPDLKKIIADLPIQRQSLFFSATIEPNISDLATGLLQDPVAVNVTPKKRSLDNIDQELRLVKTSEKISQLIKLLSSDSVTRAIVFMRTKRSCSKVEKKLCDMGLNAGSIHGDKSQNARQRTLTAFRRGKVNVLVATDVAARGIDVDDVSHVINFDMPMDAETYVHRIGRTGRAGARGVAVTFYTDGQRRDVSDIERYLGNGKDRPASRDGRSGKERGGSKGPRGRSQSRRGKSQGSRGRFQDSRGRSQGSRSRSQDSRSQDSGSRSKDSRSQDSRPTASDSRHESQHSGSRNGESKEISHDSRKKRKDRGTKKPGRPGRRERLAGKIGKQGGSGDSRPARVKNNFESKDSGDSDKRRDKPAPAGRGADKLTTAGGESSNVGKESARKKAPGKKKDPKLKGKGKRGKAKPSYSFSEEFQKQQKKKRPKRRKGESAPRKPSN